MLDCAIIGGGPAGLSAALVLGRARRNVMVFDDNRPRNAVTQESHGYLTRDGVKPGELRRLAHQEVGHYPSVQFRQAAIVGVNRTAKFRLLTDYGEVYQARTLILAAGLREILPDVPGIRDYYGKSLFNCPYCDGWEQRDRPLIVITERERGFDLAKKIYNWSRNLVVCTNGRRVLSYAQQQTLASKNIQVYEHKIASLVGVNGYLEKVVFEDGTEVLRKGGFITPEFVQAAMFGTSLGCAANASGGYATDGLGRTNVPGVYAAGDTSVVGPSQLIIAAAEGSRAAIGVDTDLTEEDF